MKKKKNLKSKLDKNKRHKITKYIKIKKLNNKIFIYVTCKKKEEANIHSN